jgi:FAD/FMN-containing dehydrogenase
MTTTTGIVPTTAQLDQLRRSFSGDVITPEATEYDNARRLWNAIHDRRPAVILRPRNADEVATAVRFGREHDLEIAVRAGGHSALGIGGRDGGLVVDLSAMRGVVADGDSRTARANGGALLGELDVAAQAHGLVVPTGVVGHTGLAGLTLGGGVGRLQRHYGLSIDNVTAIEVVTADGRIVRASETEEPELFWGLRGAGWNFGIATAFEFRLQPFGPDLHRGLMVFPATQAQEVWSVFRDFSATAPDSVAMIFGLDRAGPDQGYADELVGKPIVYIAYNHSGAADEVERDTAGLHQGPRPVSSSLGTQPYLEVQTAHDLVLGWGSRSTIMSCNGDDISPAALDAVVEAIASAPEGATFSITALGGAIGRVDEDAMAFTGRKARFDLSADSGWSDPALDEANREFARRVLDIVEPETPMGRYPNGHAEAGPDYTRAIYGDDKLARLAALKRTWDPDNVFHVNHNVEPAKAGSMGVSS